MDGFLSTSRLRVSALAFAIKLTQRIDIIPVLFDIECNIQKLSENVIFANEYSECNG